MSGKKLTIQRVWASIIGSASLLIGTLRFFIGSLRSHITLFDAIIHIVTGIIFIAGALILKGRYVWITNSVLGLIYVIFGAIELNWPHTIVGIFSVAIGLTIRYREVNRLVE